jgi:tripartite-type tricarboxylate transporter receptor subunit TctC
MSAIRQISSVARQIVLAALLCLLPGAGVAQEDYPNRPVKIVVPLAPGGWPDVLSRVIAEKLAARWKQPVFVENRPGASLNLGAEVVAGAAPDGHTVLAIPPTLVINQFVFSKLRYDPSAFTPVTILAQWPLVLVVGPNVQAADLGQFIAYAKANPGKLSFASPGVGSVPHLYAEMLKARARIDLIHVPYKGLTPAFADLLGGRVDMIFFDLGSTVRHIESGKVKALGVTGRSRIPQLSTVPAISELLPDFAVTTWLAMVAPPKTPVGIASKLSGTIAEVVQLPGVAQRFRDFHATPVVGTPEQAAAFLRNEAEHWRKVIAIAGIKPQ